MHMIKAIFKVNYLMEILTTMTFFF